MDTMQMVLGTLVTGIPAGVMYALGWFLGKKSERRKLTPRPCSCGHGHGSHLKSGKCNGTQQVRDYGGYAKYKWTPCWCVNNDGAIPPDSQAEWARRFEDVTRGWNPPT